jgi:hypothetical protein
MSNLPHLPHHGFGKGSAGWALTLPHHHPSIGCGGGAWQENSEEVRCGKWCGQWQAPRNDRERSFYD